MANSAHFGGCSSPESWHDPSSGTLAIVPPSPELDPVEARRGLFVRRDRPAARALNRNVERVFNPDRKDPHWGRRKLAQDRCRAI